MKLMQYAFMLAFLCSLIMIVWYPGNWFQLLLTAVLLLLGGIVCAVAREP